MVLKGSWFQRNQQRIDEQQKGDVAVQWQIASDWEVSCRRIIASQEWIRRKAKRGYLKEFRLPYVCVGLRRVIFSNATKIQHGAVTEPDYANILTTNHAIKTLKWWGIRQK